jgi:tRNA(Ile)-lysidine synthase
VVAEIYGALNSQPGLKFYSDEYRLVTGRNELIITPNTREESRIYYIPEAQHEIHEPIFLSFFSEAYTPDYILPRNKNTATLDFDKLSFPLILRKWRQGEYFRPLGMDGLKKISDYFIDEKLSIPEKEDAWILYSGNEVVWIVGRRIDDRFKITPSTKTIFRIELNDNDKERTI